MQRVCICCSIISQWVVSTISWDTISISNEYALFLSLLCSYCMYPQACCFHSQVLTRLLLSFSGTHLIVIYNPMWLPDCHLYSQMLSGLLPLCYILTYLFTVCSDKAECYSISPINFEIWQLYNPCLATPILPEASGNTNILGWCYLVWPFKVYRLSSDNR